MDYIYSELNNKLKDKQKTEYIPIEFEENNTIDVTQTYDNTYRFDVKTQNLVRLVNVKKDNDTSDDVIQTYQLMAYNKDTNEFDIPIGDEININHSNNSLVGNINQARIGDAIIPATIDQSGQLVLQYIPISSVVDTYYRQNSNGDYEEVYVESIIDGHD